MFNGNKTYIFGVLSILADVILLITGHIEVGAFTQILATALTAMGIRHGISKK